VLPPILTAFPVSVTVILQCVDDQAGSAGRVESDSSGGFKATLSAGAAL
jgi:hypothetical protein